MNELLLNVKNHSGTEESMGRYKVVKYGQWHWGILDSTLNDGKGLMLRKGPDPDYNKPLDDKDNKLLLFTSKETAEEYIEVNLKISLELREHMEDKNNILKQMAKDDYENGQVFDPDDFSVFQNMMKDQGYDITEDDLVQYYKYVADIAADKNGLDDIVLTETEDEICCICGEPIQGYGNNPAPVCDDGVCCDKCNIEKVIPARLSSIHALEESNQITDTLTPALDQFLMDMAQMYCDFDYNDISKFAERATVEDIKTVTNIRRTINRKLNDGYSADELTELFDKLTKVVKSSDTMQEHVAIDTYNQLNSDGIIEIEPMNESIDITRSKAQELRKTSAADVILYAYRDKKGNLVELEPEELTMDEYQERVKLITDEQTKLSDKDPRGNRYGYQKDLMFYALYKGTVTESVSVEPKDNGYHDLWELSDRYAVHNDGGRFYVFDRDNGNNHLFISDSIDEVNNYIKDELKIDVVIEPSTRIFKKRSIPSKKDIQKDRYLRDTAQIAWESGHGYDPDDFSYFKKVCKEDGYNVTEDDFAKYFEYLDEIRSEQYDLDEAILTDEEKFEREFEKLDMKASKYEQKSEKCFDKGDDEGGYYWKELADEIRREMDMMLATRPLSMEEGMKGQYTVTGVTTEGTKLYYNADTRDWHESVEDATMFTDHDIALDSWFVVTNNGKKLPDGFRRIFVPNYVTESLSEGKWNIGSNKLAIDAKEYQKLNELALMLEDNSPNNYKYEVRKTYEDFGAGMQWYTVICYDNKGDHWQVLNTKEWLDLMNTGDVQKVYNDIISDNHFQDKSKGVDEMNLSELFASMDD